MESPTSDLRHGRAARPWIVAHAVVWLAVGGSCASPNPPDPTRPVDGAAVRDASDADEEPEATSNDAGYEVSPRGDAEGDVDARSFDVHVDIGSECPLRVDIVEACVLSSDGALVATPLVGAMTISAIEDIPAGACRITGFDSPIPSPPSGTERATRLTLDAGDGTRRNVVIRAVGLPPALLRVGETIDLSLQAWEDVAAFSRTLNQTFVLARGDQPVFVAATLTLYRLPMPNLTAAGIQLDDDGIVCRGTFSMSCTPEDHRLRASYGGESATLLPGETAQLGSLTLMLESFRARVGPACDAKGSTQMAGFWSP